MLSLLISSGHVVFLDSIVGTAEPVCLLFCNSLSHSPQYAGTLFRLRITFLFFCDAAALPLSSGFDLDFCNQRNRDDGGMEIRWAADCRRALCTRGVI